MISSEQSRERLEELLNATSHGVGAVLSLIGLVVLIVAAYTYGGVWHRVSFSIYGSSLVLLYVASTLYHSFRDTKIKYVLKICDHAAIYLVIAGTYTPFALVIFHGTLGWIIFTVIWTLALLGITQQILFVKRFKVFSTLCYLGMGWLIAAFINPLISVFPSTGLWWLVSGGIFYTVGAGFYLWRQIPFNHAVWHFFVLAGSIAHFITIYRFVLPAVVPY